MTASRDSYLGVEQALEFTTAPLILRCAAPQAEDGDNSRSVEDRQSRVPGFSQDALSNLTVLVVGAGALGGEIAEGLVRKGVGALKILDFDAVAMTNLTRQKFFLHDVYSPKAWALARNLEPHGALGTQIIAWNLAFENALVDEEVDLSCDVVVSAVDDAQTRIAIDQFALDRKIPAIFGGASERADYANIFVQEVGKTCFACAFPDQAEGARTPCPGSPAIKDLFMQVGGLMVYAIDTLFMDRPRDWNLHSLCPSDAELTRSGWAPRREDCPVCGEYAREPQAP